MIMNFMYTATLDFVAYSIWYQLFGTAGTGIYLVLSAIPMWLIYRYLRETSPQILLAIVSGPNQPRSAAPPI